VKNSEFPHSLGFIYQHYNFRTVRENPISLIPIIIPSVYVCICAYVYLCVCVCVYVYMYVRASLNKKVTLPHLYMTVI